MLPIPTPILRIVHIDNLATLLSRKALHSSSCIPSDGLAYKLIHNTSIQEKRSHRIVPCGPGGLITDYVPFYFGYLSPMLLQIHTKQVPEYEEAQVNIVYLVSDAQKVESNRLKYVFTDGHGLKKYTKWYCNLSDLDKINWSIVNQKQWADQDDDNDRKRKKQAEFLIHKLCPWSLVSELVVIDQNAKNRVRKIFELFPTELHRPIKVMRNWYY